MLVTKTINKWDKPTAEQLEQLKKAAKMPITYDEDCPELTPKMEEAFIRAAQERRKASTYVINDVNI